MEPHLSERKPTDVFVDLNLPIPEGAMPVLPAITPAEAFALNDELVARTVYDEKYMRESLAHKNPERFVM